MIEAVGHEHLATYFKQIGRMLKPGGRAVIQVIAEPDERYEAYCNSSDFIREHIFPGGHLPSMGAMVEAARGTGLSVQVSSFLKIRCENMLCVGSQIFARSNCMLLKCHPITHSEEYI